MMFRPNKTDRLRATVWFVLATLMLAMPAQAHGEQAHGEQAHGERVFRVAIPLENPERQLRRLQSLELDLHGFNGRSGRAYLIVTESEMASLETDGFQPEVLEETTPTEERLAALSDYLDAVETASEVDRVTAAFPEIARKFSYGETTHEGRSVGYLKISDNVDQDEPEPRILFVSQHHAREVMTPEVMIDMADYLTQRYGTDPEVTAWVDNYEIFIIPSHNPDGTAYVFSTNNNWRKNRFPNGDGSFGVDPNRNYDYRWGGAGCAGSSGSPSSDTYRGPSAASEPETRGLNALALTVRPSISLTYHTYSELVLHPFGCESTLPDDPDLRAHRDVGSSLAAAIENDAGDGTYEMGTAPELLYAVDGDSDGWLHAVAGTVGFTIEMNAASLGFQPDYATWRDDTVQRNREGWKYLLRRLDQGVVHGQARDACTGAGIEAEVGVVEQQFLQGQVPRVSLPAHGFFHRVLEPGAYTWYGEAAGYQRQEWPVDVAFAPVQQDLWLVPSGERGLELRGFRVDDSSGDADSQLDPGETVWLWPTAIASGEATSGITATLTTSDPYLEVLDGSASFADLAAGEEAEALGAFQVRVQADAPDDYLAAVTVGFGAIETLCRAGADQTLRISRGIPACPFEQVDLDTDPGWTASGPSGGWEFGPPQGDGSEGGPQAARSGGNVYGTVLDGNYGSSAGEFILTTTPFDLQGLRNGELQFWRWLNNEPGYDYARVEVSIDQVEWTEIWKGYGRDTRWEHYRLPLPAFTEDADQVWIRFILRQDGGGTRSGLYLDDVSICGESSLSAGGKLKLEDWTVLESDPNYGNNDGAADNGETVRLVASLRSTRDADTRIVSAVLTTSDPDVIIHNGSALYPDIPAGGVADSLAPHFSFTLDGGCGDRIPFALEARYENGLTTISRFELPVGTLEPGTLFVDDMEIQQAWTAGGSASQGAWDWGDPVGNTNQGVPTNPEDDHTPAPGVSAWVTQNLPFPAPATQGDVDGGSSTLTSPLLNAAAYDQLELHYWRWFYTDGNDDTLRIEVSNDGETFYTVEEVGSNANTWSEARFEISELVQPGDAFRVRFSATDGGGDNIVEAGIDDLSLEGTVYGCEPFEPPTMDPPGSVGDTLRVDKRGFDAMLSWTAPAAGGGDGPATFYRVDRSEAASNGFATVAQPTDAQHLDTGAAGPSAPSVLFYLVEAENNGGSSP